VLWEIGVAKKRRTPQAKTSVSQDQPFLSAVLAEPEDDAPRLAYADWMDKHGQPERAEFIRLQMERALRPYLESVTPSARETALLSAHRREWLGPLPEWLHERFEFHRGFPERARYVEMADFLRWDASIWEFAPVIDVAFTDYPAVTGSYRLAEEKKKMLRALAAKTELGHVRILNLVELGLSAADLKILLSSSHLSRLHDLNLGGPNFSPAETGRVLACVSRLPALTRLNLEANQIGDEEVRLLLKSPVMRRLTNLGLGNSNIGDLGAEYLATSPHVGQLKYLHLYCNMIGDRGARALADSPHLGRLKELALMVNEISTEGQQVLREQFGERVHF
jgi:uncharacterized protein (TIGR02996 family)